jgi:hypothetical protein
MISRASYVQCDRCGDPAQVSVEGAKGARAHARQEGFKRIAVDTGLRHEDVCPRCLRASSKEVGGE